MFVEQPYTLDQMLRRSGSGHPLRGERLDDSLDVGAAAGADEGLERTHRIRVRRERRRSIRRILTLGLWWD